MLRVSITVVSFLALIWTSPVGCGKDDSSVQSGGEGAAASTERDNGEARKKRQAQQKAVIEAEGAGRHAGALALLDGMEGQDAWAKGFRRSVQIIRSFDDEVGIGFVKFMHDKASLKGLSSSTDTASVQGDIARLKRLQRELIEQFAKVAVKGKVEMPKALAAAPDNPLAKELVAFFEGEGATPVGTYAQLGVRYQKTGQVDLEQLRTVLNRAP